MNCPSCGEEIRADFYCDTPGAMFVTLDSANDCPYIWPATFGLKKYKGCVEFGTGISNRTAEDEFDDGDGVMSCLFKSECIEAYYDFPKTGEAWLVTPKGKDWEWERVDDQIEFSN